MTVMICGWWNHSLEVEPAPSRELWAHDVLNNSIGYLEWPQGLRTSRLSIVSRST